MTIYFNDKATEMPDGTTLDKALDLAELPSTGIATALNGNVVTRDKRAETVLNDGDKILIIKAFYGG